MPSISSRTDLSQGVPRQAKSSLAALPIRVSRWISCWLVQWYENWRELRDLAELDEYRLRDIGLTKTDVRGSIVAPHRDTNLKP